MGDALEQGMSNTEKVIGSVTLAERAEIADSFESAAAYHVIAVEPGEYPIVASYDKHSGKWHLSVRYTGKVISSGYGPKSYPERLGKLDTVSERPYKYQLDGSNNFGYRMQPVRPGRVSKIRITDGETFDACAM